MPKRIVFAALLVIPLLFSTASAEGPFDKGRSNVTFQLGAGSTFNDDYILLGLGYGYFLVDGLRLGIQFDLWLNGDPSIYQVTPEVAYVFHKVPHVKPYVGAFYRRSYIEGLDDLDALGYRAGAYFTAGGGAYIGFGYAWSEYQDCEETVYTDCDSSYTELTFVVAF